MLFNYYVQYSMYFNGILSHIVYCLLFAVKRFCFSWITSQPQKFFGEFLHMNTMKAC